MDRGGESRWRCRSDCSIAHAIHRAWQRRRVAATARRVRNCGAERKCAHRLRRDSSGRRVLHHRSAGDDFAFTAVAARGIARARRRSVSSRTTLSKRCGRCCDGSPSCRTLHMIPSAGFRRVSLTERTARCDSVAQICAVSRNGRVLIGPVVPAECPHGLDAGRW